MRSTRSFSWYDLRDSLWYRPAIMTAVAIALSFLTIWLDHVLFRDQRVDAWYTWWLFEGGAEGARGVLTAIAGTMMTVATTAFSFTLVALQLSSSQYSPRVVRHFTGDPVNQVVIGAFVGTFVYTLLVLRVVRSESADMETFVPAISVSVALLLALACIGSLIFFFHHATRTIQGSVIIDRTTSHARDVIAGLRSRYSEGDWRFPDAPVTRPPGLKPVGVVRSRDAGYVQDVMHDRLIALAETHDLLVEARSRAGDFLMAGDEQFIIWGYGEPLDIDPARTREEDTNGDLLEQFDGMMELGLERTLEWDAALGLQQIADIAVRALSPGINDPTTATICIDRSGELLVELEPISCAEAAWLDERGVLRLIQPRRKWEDLVQTALNPIRHYGAADPGVAVHVLQTLGRVAQRVPPLSHGPLVAVARDMAEASLGSATVESDHTLIREAQDHIGKRR